MIPDCNGNGDVELPFGSAEYVGLGFSVFATLVLVELFGSPALRNIQVQLAHSLALCVLLSQFVVCELWDLEGTEAQRLCSPCLCSLSVRRAATTHGTLVPTGGADTLPLCTLY